MNPTAQQIIASHEQNISETGVKLNRTVVWWYIGWILALIPGIQYIGLLMVATLGHKADRQNEGIFFSKGYIEGFQEGLNFKGERRI